MSNTAMRKWAEALTGFSAEVKPGNSVAIITGAAAEPLATEIYREVLRRGGHPVMLPNFTGVSTDLWKLGNDDQLSWITPVERFVREEADVTIFIIADTNTRTGSSVDPSRRAVWVKARKELFECFSEREASGDVRWTLTLFPTDAYAQEAEMSTGEFAAFVASACKLDEPDTVAAWKQQAMEQQRLIDWLTPRGEVHIVAPETDLRLSTAGRTWINADGRKNFPDGEVFTGPIEDSASGHIAFSYPAIYAGREVDGVRLRFADGKVVDAGATKGEDTLIQTLDIDEGARRLGEFAFGTNFGIARFVREMLFDEKIGGTLHMAVGDGYGESGSLNKSSVHWDMLLDLRQGGAVTVDGEPFLVAGKFVV